MGKETVGLDTAQVLCLLLVHPNHETWVTIGFVVFSSLTCSQLVELSNTIGERNNVIDLICASEITVGQGRLNRWIPVINKDQ